MRPTQEALRALFVNENIGGHAVLHAHLRRSLTEHPEVVSTVYDVPPPRWMRRLAAVRVPGLARLDADLQVVRAHLTVSAVVRRFLRKHASAHDVLHVYTQNAALLSVSVLRRMPTVVSTDSANSIHNYQLPTRLPGPLTRASLLPDMKLERRVLDAATLVVAQSNWIAKQLAALGIDPERIRVIPFGITVPPAMPARTSNGAFRITFVGSTMERKGGNRLLDVFERTDVLRDLYRLTLVTRDRVSPRPGVDLINDLEPGDPRLHRLLAETAVFVLPTMIDKAPYAVLEAMAAGLPVLSTTVGAIPEMVDDGTTGMLVEPGDDRALAAALTTLTQEPLTRQRMGAAGRARFLERFDARITTQSLIDVLEEARRLHARAARPPQ